MGFSDTINYVLYDNPISQGVTNATIHILKPIISSANGLVNGQQQAPMQIVTKTEPLWQLARDAGPYVKIAGLSGACAVGLAAYGAHKKYPKEKIDELKSVQEIANRMHFFHTLALFGVPMTRSPKVAGSLLIVGTILFSGPCYYHAFTGENKFARLAPIGGTILILGWLSMVF